MITPRKKLEEYRKLLQLRYETLNKALMGREADYEKQEDRRHNVPRGRTYTKEWVDQCNISNSLDVRIAVDDFQTVLKEIKKLAAK